MNYKLALNKSAADSQAPWYTVTGLRQRLQGKPRQWIHAAHQTAKDVADWAGDVGEEAAYYGKGLQYLPEVDPQTWEDAVHDAPISVPRGVVRGTNLLTQSAAGELRGASDLAQRLLRDRSNKYMSPEGAQLTERLFRKPLTSFSKALENAQGKSNYATNAFLDYWKYRDPTNPALKPAEAIGTAIPAAAALEMAANPGEMTRIFAPFRASDATGLLHNLPVLGSSKVINAAHRTASSPVFGAITNAATMGIPLTDYLFGYTHKNPHDSELVQYLKDTVANIPSAAGTLNPAAYLNAKINSSMERMEPRAEYAGRAAADIGALLGNKRNGFVGQMAAPLKERFIDWLNTPWYTDPYKKYIKGTLEDLERGAAESAKGLPGEIAAEVAANAKPVTSTMRFKRNPSKETAVNIFTPYKQYAKDTAVDFITNAPNRALENQGKRLAELKSGLRYGPGEGYLRWMGIQPVSKPYWSKPYTLKERGRLAKAFQRGVNSGLESRDNQENLIGTAGVELKDQAKRTFADIKRFKQDGRPGDAVTIIMQDIPELAKKFMSVIKNNQ